jgi:hypothetical protein
MAFDSYSDLQTSIASYLARSDLTTQIPDFISFVVIYGFGKCCPPLR